MKEKIGIDFTFISAKEIRQGRLTGSIGIFLGDLLDEIMVSNQADRFILIINAAAESFVKARFPSFECCLVGNFVPKIVNRVLAGKLMRFFKYVGVYSHILRNSDIRHIWFPWMVPEEVNYVDCEYVGTCHDLIMREANSDASCKKMFNNAQHTICISSFVEQQVLSLYECEKQKISVIPNSLSIEKITKDAKEISFLRNKKFILDVNAYIPRKNTLVLLKAFKSIYSKIDYDLVLCGGYKDNKYFADCLDYVKVNGLSDRVSILYAIDEKEKNWLFQHCGLFVTPSSNEGLGRTPIEAALCLKPVISSKETALFEATCGLVHYIKNSSDYKELADVILKIIDNPDDLEKLEHIKEQLSSRYKPKRIIDNYFEVFRKLGWL